MAGGRIDNFAGLFEGFAAADPKVDAAVQTVRSVCEKTAHNIAGEHAKEAVAAVPVTGSPRDAVKGLLLALAPTGMEEGSRNKILDYASGRLAKFAVFGGHAL